MRDDSNGEKLWPSRVISWLCCATVAVAMTGTSAAFAQQNTPSVRVPDRQPPIQTVPDIERPIVESRDADQCVSIADSDDLLEELKAKALTRVEQNGANRQAFLSSIPSTDRVAQCKYYNKVIQLYSR